MKYFILALSTLLTATIATAAPLNFAQYKLKDIDGKEVSLNDYKGKTLLIVNTASKCGYTSQYEALEQTYSKYKDKGLVVLGFPSNDFGGQEPGSDADIKAFCQKNYKVNFPMFSKGAVKGSEKQQLFKFLTENAPEKGEIKWNFEKFLVNSEGNVVGRFGSSVTPDSAKLTTAVEAAIKR